MKVKLYTEEQVNFAMRYATVTKDSYSEVLKQLIPIELPSDEEIEKQTKDFMFEKNKAVFCNGAKWMKQQILNQNNL